MILFAYLRDHEDKECDKARLEFVNDQATCKMLQEKLSQRFQISQEYQQMFLANGTEIFKFNPDDTLQKIGLKHMDDVIVKHLNVDVWANVVRRASNINKFVGEEQSLSAKATLELIEAIDKSQFFVPYHRLLDKMEQIRHEMKEYLGGDLTTMKSATQFYFYKHLDEHKLLKDPTTFAVKVGGSQQVQNKQAATM
ncbi:hypothetical protein M3Y98_00156100 [Aphelenchoides besseyi]|nr:hypothetical protein M3Y98_00156100 [Aphelenchoides besseyi]